MRLALESPPRRRLPFDVVRTVDAIRILHISDLHARGAWEVDQRRIVEGFLTDVTEQHQVRAIDLIVMSGDLAWGGQRDQFRLARDLVIDPLMAQTGLAPESVVLVPGNHDVERPAIDKYAEKGWALACDTRDGAVELMDDDRALAGAAARLGTWKGFHDNFYEEVSLEYPGPLATVHSLSIAGRSVGIAALNSAWRASGDEDKGNLLVGERQLLPALSAIEGADIPIVVVHHPLNWLKDFDSDAARTEFASRGVLVLTGHEHMSDPMAVKTGRGEIVYSRAGSLFATFEYTNAYSLIDISPRERSTAFVLRTWFGRRRVFDESTDVTKAGQMTLDWPMPASTDLTTPLRYSAVVATLTDRVELHSALADRLETQRPFDDLVVAPRLLPTPYREGTAAVAVDPKRRLGRVDAVAQLSTARVLIVAGEPESGVTTTLLWVLKHVFDGDELRAPVVTRFDDQFGRTQFERAAQRWLRAYGLSTQRSNLPPLLTAIDDVTPGSVDAFARLVALALDRETDRFVLGCREEHYEAVHTALESAGIATEAAFVAPFGRRELRELHARMVGPDRLELLERVTAVVGREGLPRNPFVLSALVAVLADHQDLGSLNESGVLEGYVDLLLSDALPDLDRLGMDKRRREHLLASLAKYLHESGTGSASELDVESYLQQYFRGQGWLSASPGRVLASLVRRRILSVADETVSFRHSALFNLFQGAAYYDDPEFAAKLLSEPLANAPAIRHAAGLKRDDRDLLEFILGLAEGALAPEDEVDLSIYDPDPSRLGSLMASMAELEAQPPWLTHEEMDQRLDEMEDVRAGSGQVALPPLRPESKELGNIVALLSHVLRNTELSTDLELKQKALRAAVTGWSKLGAVIVRDLESGLLSEEITLRLARLTNVDVNDEAIAEIVPAMRQMVRHVLAISMALGMSAAIASRHMEGVVEQAMDDEQLMGDAVSAFFLTILYSTLGRPDWPERLGRAYGRHSSNETLSFTLRSWAMIQYRSTPDSREAERLEVVLAQIYSTRPQARGGAAVIARGQERGAVIARLKTLRASAQQAESSIESKLDPLDAEEQTASIYEATSTPSPQPRVRPGAGR